MSSIGMSGVPLTPDDERVLGRIQGVARTHNESASISRELSLMREVGKHELQWVYGHELGPQYMARGFVQQAIMTGDYL